MSLHLVFINAYLVLSSSIAIISGHTMSGLLLGHHLDCPPPHHQLRIIFDLIHFSGYFLINKIQIGHLYVKQPITVNVAKKGNFNIGK